MLPGSLWARASRHAANPAPQPSPYPKDSAQLTEVHALGHVAAHLRNVVDAAAGGDRKAHTVGAHGAAADWPDRTAARTATCTVTCLTRAASAGRAAAGCGRRGLGGHLHGVRRCVQGRERRSNAAAHGMPSPHVCGARQHPPDTPRGPAALCSSGRGRSGQQPDRHQLLSACRNVLPLACNCASCHRDAGGAWGALRAAGRVRAVRGLAGGAPLGSEAAGGADLSMACRVGSPKRRSRPDSAADVAAAGNFNYAGETDSLHIGMPSSRSRCWRASCTSSVSLLAAAPRPGCAIGPAPPLINQ